MTTEERETIRSCLDLEIEACARAVTMRPYRPLDDGGERFDPRKVWLGKLERARIALFEVKLK